VKCAETTVKIICGSPSSDKHFGGHEDVFPPEDLPKHVDMLRFSYILGVQFARLMS
jgi:hypothetical protein